MSQQWTSGRQVMNDLAELSGNRFNSVLNPVTDRPPPFANDYEEGINEICNYFGQDVIKNVDHCVDINIIPDHDGIQSMLKMAREFDDNFPEYNEAELPHSDNGTLEITKTESVKNHSLNPNVKEFIPAHMVGNNKNSKTNNKDVKDENKTEMASAAGAGNNVLVDINNQRIDVTKLQPHEADIIANELKNKIKEMSKTMKNKLHRNAALQSITKCYSVLSTPEQQPTKLLTPDYFKASCEPHEASSKSHEEVTENVKQEDDSETMTAYIKQSIDKVENWQKSIENEKSSENSVCSIKAPAVFKPQLKPFTYKKKQKIEKPTMEVSTPATASSASSLSSSKQYVPSQHASELYELFTKQAALRDKLEDISLWDKLERQLKEKDEQIKKQKTDVENKL